MKETERLKNTKLNVSSNLIIYLLQAILSFIVRTIFIKKLGTDILGLDNLIINILNILSLAELGLGTAISYSLYKPLAEKRIKKINAYMSFYRKIYNIIGVIVLIIGIILALFLQKIIGDYSYKYLYLIYFLYLINIVSSYFISYKDILISADQKNYKIFKYNFITKILIYLLQLIVLLLTNNYILYVLILVMLTIINRLFINRFITKYYSNVDFNSKEKLSKKDINVIKETVFGLVFYKMGDYLLNGTDSIIISCIINVANVGIYTNYLSITSILKSIIKNIFSGVTSSLGNLTTINNKKSELEVYDIMVFLSFIVGGFISLCLIYLINPFIVLWIGKDYLLSTSVVLCICINFYLFCNQLPLSTIKEANGFYKKDRYIPLIQSIINIILSIILGYYIGLFGIVVATTISYITTSFWIEPYIINKNLYGISSKRYYISQIKYIITLIIIYFIAGSIINMLNLSVSILNFIIIGLIITIIYVSVITVSYRKNKGYIFIKDFIKNQIEGMLKHE